MRYKKFIQLLFIFISTTTFAQYNDPNIPKPVSGYGSDGTHTVGKISFANPNFLSKDIEIYYPADIQSHVPTIFYSHAYGGNVSENISGMLNFVAKKGYGIVYVPYQTLGVSVEDRYNNLLSGFRKAARDYPLIIDTTRVGFMGHSFGGGASFGLSYKCFTENHWGSNGRFIYALAQWYSYYISPTDLSLFPQDTYLLTEVFDDDTTNDHRMAIDIFNHINIPADNKNFLLVKSDTISGYIYSAEHNLPNTSSAFDALDYYAYYRFIDALCDYTFNRNTDAKNVALGNGSLEQVTMPNGLKPLVETNSPVPLYPESKYGFTCSSTENPREEFCGETTEVNDNAIQEKQVKLFPNPVTESLNMHLTSLNNAESVMIYNLSGESVCSIKVEEKDINMNVAFLKPGIYFLKYNQMYSKFIKL